eukprot:9359557-Karenia_brevis.AAC.2
MLVAQAEAPRSPLIEQRRNSDHCLSFFQAEMAAQKLIMSRPRSRLLHIVEQWRDALPLSALCSSRDGREEADHNKAKAPTVPSCTAMARPAAA